MTAKQTILEIINGVDEDADWDEILYQLEVRRRVQDGLKAFKDGKGIPLAEIEKRFAPWNGE